jgi:DegV family protein with EDD domain
MQIVTDSGTDTLLAAGQDLGSLAHVVPLTVTLDGRTYREGVDIQPDEFYRLLAATGSLPVTSQPAAGEFAATYRRLAATDPEILSIHISSGLSGTVNAAQVGASQVPEAHVTVVDTKTLSAPAGWQVEAALRAARAGWSREQILALISRIAGASDCLYTLSDLKYLIHGGRISHMKGLLASVLNIKPVIGVEKERGTYVQLSQARAFKGAVHALVEQMARQHTPGSALRVQVLYANNPDGAQLLHQEVEKRFACTWLPVGPMSLVLGAHTGPSMVGVAYAPLDVFAALP